MSLPRVLPIREPGDDTDANEDETLASRAGAMVARVFVNDLRQCIAPWSSAAHRMRTGMNLLHPADGSHGDFYRHLAEAFQDGFANELARQLEMRRS